MNGLFLLFALALCLLALAFVVVPLLREPPGDDADTQRAVNLAVHRDRVRELDQDLAAGTLTRAQYDIALADLERELLDSGAVDPEEVPAKGPGVGRLPRVAAFASVAAVPFLAVGIYLSVGHADEVFATQLPPGEMQAAPREAPPSDEQLQREFERLAQQLQGRLAQEPEDLESWVLLGRTLVFLDDLEAAERAFREAMRHGGERDPDLLTRYADVLAERQGSLAGEPMALIEQALALDPDHAQGLWMAGTQAFQAAELDAARRHWERLLGTLDEDSPEAEIIRGNLAQLARAAEEG
ncbi:c-type cytochrome biogenesis protein CcmI [Halomonas campisalis]|uniref:C-type cytochrome biogenesis protein CcmI n=1 Tax=Billgrantia campisalis TaxID=74661 RepID=A0ABS9P4X2_9GAMM|nr:c-type cytochrome biogenesis protein CcmI [Halomonas campisalis]MCG6656830.1 c-type cytochrome biogenesis protein CcmI [Halomonas campisalis]MDR5862019.1 c-type cytochrome biogenesis protein CcmI [Halomonas campisalis]